jgi:hypothetical protein
MFTKKTNLESSISQLCPEAHRFLSPLHYQKVFFQSCPRCITEMSNKTRTFSKVINFAENGK